MTDSQTTECDLAVLIPIFNDWDAATALLSEFDRIRASLPETVHFLFVDDGSTEAAPTNFGEHLDETTSFEVLSLPRNIGHQRAIAVGLCHLYESWMFTGVVVMDGDGQDPPDAIPRLLRARASAEKVVFASRLRRTEGPVFTLFYHSYRFLHLILTGVKVRFGNFSYIPSTRLRTLVVSPELWNHYAATVIVSGIPYTSVAIDRRRRLDGSSKMNFTALVAHGIRALSVFDSVVGTRVLIGVAGLAFLTILALACVLAARVDILAVTGWTTYAGTIIILMIIQIVGTAFFFAFQFMGTRSRSSVIPLRDYRWFVEDDRTGVRL